MGDVQRALGDESAARGRYEQSLEVSERLVMLTGESPEALRDWSVSLSNVGDVQRAMGDAAAARGRFEQSLEVRERLVKLTGESPEALSDLAIGLERLADLCRDQGDQEGARALYQRGLAVGTAALRQSPLARDIQQLVVVAQARLAALAALNTPPS
ncbi:MAG: tetratricopeptide repeat protein [Microbacteriaceae bacterium]|nr:tetratricopeptide repeat protein [Burkholderiaceae bacterium]